MEDRFEVGKEVISERYGDFKEEPKSFDTESGLVENDMGAYTKMNFPKSGEGYGDPQPNQIVVDEDLSDKETTKSLVHELIEWRAIEELSKEEVLEERTHTIASYNENTICREVNERAGEEICDVSWNRNLNT